VKYYAKNIEVATPDILKDKQGLIKVADLEKNYDEKSVRVSTKPAEMSFLDHLREIYNGDQETRNKLKLISLFSLIIVLTAVTVLIVIIFVPHRTPE